ncbi:MAG: tetratricopeptide repeat protein [Bacteroidota bacterium]
MKKFRNYLLFLVVFSALSVIVNGLQAQEHKADSLIALLKTLKRDTSEVNALTSLAATYMNMANYDQALLYSKQALEQAEKLNYKKGIGKAYNGIGLFYFYQANYEKALEYYQQSLMIWNKIGDKKGAAIAYNNIGGTYLSQGDYEKALQNCLKALKINDETGNKEGIAKGYNTIGAIYYYQGNYAETLNNFFKALNIQEKIGDIEGKAQSYDNIGSVYGMQNNYAKALEFQLKALKINEEIGNKNSIADSYSNIGVSYEKQLNYPQALENHFKALKIRKEAGEKAGIAACYDNIGSIYMYQNKLDLAADYLNQSLILSKEIGSKEAMKENYISLTNLYDKKGDYKQAYIYHKLYADIKDTLLNEQSGKQIAEMNTKYHSEKKDKELIQKDAEISQHQIETEKKNFQRNAFIIGFILVLMLAFYIYRGYRQKQLANNSLEEKNTLIENQKQLVEDKNKKITDSISYAKRIQQAILPSEELLKSALPNSFIFFKPKDIVSGDFYWFHSLNENEVLIAAADCTGHGVPGALMSMMAYNLLEQVVKEHHIYEPAIILNELSRLIIESLKQTDQPGAVKDGMDIALCKINFEKRELEYAGAHNPLYLIRNDILTETKANSRSVGISTSKATHFLNHKIKLEQGDCLYIFSDGYADQKGGPKNEKFFYQPFRNLLTEIHQSDVKDQQNVLGKTLSEWIGDKEQIDDVLVIGIKC